MANINKRIRDLSLGHDTTDELPTKTMNLNTKIPSMKTGVFYDDRIHEMDLFSELFSVWGAEYVIVFFCDYDFTQQSRQDLYQIQQSCPKFKEYKAVAIVITHDRPNVHCAYATPYFTNYSLDYSPSFILASDSANRLLSTAFNSINLKNFSIIRSMHVIDPQYKLVLSHTIPEHTKFFPMHYIFNTLNHPVTTNKH
ncbi:hypothetical protein G6F56_004707 [Rhizopus delemar]|nr:hypothetical protein G6F56_004707 [Rhizopus delemar]